MKNRLLLEKISTFILPDINNIIKFHAGSFGVFISASLLQRRKEKKNLCWMELLALIQFLGWNFGSMLNINSD